MGTAIYEPYRFFYFAPGQSPPYAFDGATETAPASEDTGVLDFLSDSDDDTGVHFGQLFFNLNHQFYIHYEPDTPLPATARVDSIRVDFRARHVEPYGYMWAYDLRGFDSVGIPHFKYLGGPVRHASNALPVDSSTPTVRSFDDGTLVRGIGSLHVLWGRFTHDGIQTGWSPGTHPYLVETFLTVGYTEQPTVTDIEPNTTTDDPRPYVQWAVGNIDQQLPSAHQVILLPAGSTDANANAVGDPDFDPLTGSGVGYNSGKTFTGATNQQVSTVLPPGTWHIYVKEWVGSGIYEYASEWGHQDFVLDALTVDQPTISLADDVASNTVLVTLTAGSHTEDLVADTIEVQILDPVYGWLAAPISNSMVNGTGVSAFYDGLRAPEEEISYRARGVAALETVIYVSPWTVATHTVGNLHQWWLRSSSDYTLNRSLHSETGLLMKTWTPTRRRPNTTTWGIGARPATVVHDITKGDVHDCSIWAMTQTAYNDLRALLEDPDDLVLVNPWGEIWRVQTGDEVSEEIMRAAPRSDELTAIGFVRVVSVTFIEVVTP